MASFRSSVPVKVCIVGDGGVGKSTFVKRHRTGDFEKKYIATMGVEVSPIRFATSAGPITFNIWDCAGQEQFGGLRDGYWMGCNFFMVFFDVTSLNSYKNAEGWICSIIDSNPKARIVLCGNKVDCRARQVMPSQILLHRKYQIPYFDISSKTNYNFEKPFLALIRYAFNNEQIHEVEMPPVVPPTVSHVISSFAHRIPYILPIKALSANL